MTTATTRPPDGPPPRRRPPGRYDPPSRAVPRGIAVVLSVLFLGLLVAIALNFYTRYGLADVEGRARGFEVLSDRQVRIDLDVSAPPGETAWCLLRARSADGAEVGRVFVPVAFAAGGPGEQRVAHRLDTSARAVTGELVRCLLSEPPAGQPRAEPDPGVDP